MDWRPIDEAPDDVLCLVHQPEAENRGKWFKSVFCAVQVSPGEWWAQGAGVQRTRYDERLNPPPTHWMPLPSPPHKEQSDE